MSYSLPVGGIDKGVPTGLAAVGLASGLFATAAAGFEPPANRLASGLRGLQSDGGNETRQNFELGCTNSTPISAVPFAPALTSTTVQRISSSVFRFRILTVAPLCTASFSKINPPCAFTSSVKVFFREGCTIGALSGYAQRHGQQNALTAPLLSGHSRTPVRCRNHAKPLLWISARNPKRVSAICRTVAKNGLPIRVL